MDDTNLQETTARANTKIDAKIDALSAEMAARFDRAFEQTQGGFDDFKAFATFVRTESAEQFKQVHRRFDGLERRFDGMDRFDRLERLIKDR